MEVPRVPQKLDCAKVAALAVSPDDLVSQLDFCNKAEPVISYNEYIDL